nr:unnamed protein product [Digitaria exilis]
MLHRLPYRWSRRANVAAKATRWTSPADMTRSKDINTRCDTVKLQEAPASEPWCRHRSNNPAS